MTDEGKQFKLNLRLPKVLEDKCRDHAKLFDMSLNDVVKACVIQYFFPSHQQPVVFQNGPASGPADGAKTTTKRKKRNGPTGGPANGAKKANPSRAQINMSKHKDIYTYDNNNNIVFSNPTTQEHWDKFRAYRQKIKKPLNEITEEYQAPDINWVLENEGEEQLRQRLIRTIQSGGWTGFVFASDKSAIQSAPSSSYDPSDS